VNAQRESPPAAVPSEGAKQAGEARPCKEWAEPTVWTDKMLGTLDTGVKGGKWFSLVDKVWGMGNLHSAFRSV
jgi:RNA-directed DNA polymerase